MFVNKPYLLLIFLSLVLNSCSGFKEVTSTYSERQAIQGLTEKWPSGSETRIETNNLDYYISNNDEYVILRIDLKNQRIIEDAKRYGFTVYFDNAQKVKRSFGITYPAGVSTLIAEIPGAQRAYFENPGWENIPSNRRMIEGIERNVSREAMIMQRRDRSASIRPLPISLNQLRAQGIDLIMDQSTRNMSLVFKVPLISSRHYQFALDTGPGQVFNLGFEVKPPTIHEIDPDNDISDEARSRITRQLPTPFEYWVKIRLAESNTKL